MASHRYWRLYISAAANFPNISELRFLDASGNDISTTGANASASSTYPGGFTASNAFDQNTTTLWSANGNAPQWLMYDFGVATDVAAAMITPRIGASSYPPTAFSIQYSDDNSTWTSIITVASITFTANCNLTVLFTAPPANEYANYQIVPTASISGNVAWAEMICAATPGGSNIGNNTNYIAATGSLSSSYLPTNAIDNNNATIWAGGAGMQTIRYSFGAAILLAEIRLVAPPSANVNDTPTAFTIQGSNDGVTWTTLATATGLSWTANQSRTYTLNAVASASGGKAQINNVIT